MRSLVRTWQLLANLGREIGVSVCVLYAVVSSTVFLAPLLVALGLRPLVDGAVGHRSGQTALGAALVGIALLLTVLAPTGYRWATIRMRERSRMVVNKRVLGLSASAPRVDHFERPEFWDRLQLLRRGTEDLANGMALVLIGPIVVLQLAVAAALLGRIQPLLAVVPVVALPAIRLSGRAAERLQKAERAAAEQRRLAHRLFEVSASADSGMELRVLGIQEDLVDRHREASAAAHRKTERAAFSAMAATTTSWLLFAGTYAGALLLVIRSAARHEATVGDVAGVAAMAGAVIGAAGRLADMAGSITRVTAVADHYRWLETQAAGEAPVDPAPVPDRLTRGISLQNVSFAYGEGAPVVLSDVSLDLPAGAVVAIVGENGAGKSTLVKLLCGFYAPRTGQILIDGRDQAAMDPVAFRRRITAGFQDFARFELSVGTTVAVGDLDTVSDPAITRAALDRVQADFVEQLPQGVDTQLGLAWEGGVELSGGQWQKLAMARTFVRTDPLLLVLDEPTASLDPEAEHALFQAVAEDAERGRDAGRITVLISHRVSTTRMADLIVVLDGGRVREQGSHDELMARDGLYAELFQLQEHAYRL